MKKIVTMFMMTLAVLAVSCAADKETSGGSSPKPDSHKALDIDGIKFNTQGAGTATFAKANTYTGTAFGTAFKAKADTAYSVTSGLVTIKTGSTPVTTEKLVEGTYAIEYAYSGKTVEYELEVGKETVAPLTPITDADVDVTITGVTAAGVTPFPIVITDAAAAGVNVTLSGADKTASVAALATSADGILKVVTDANGMDFGTSTVTAGAVTGGDVVGNKVELTITLKALPSHQFTTGGNSTTKVVKVTLTSVIGKFVD